MVDAARGGTDPQLERALEELLKPTKVGGKLPGDAPVRIEAKAPEKARETKPGKDSATGTNAALPALPVPARL